MSQNASAGERAARSSSIPSLLSCQLPFDLTFLDCAVCFLLYWPYPFTLMCPDLEFRFLLYRI